MPDNKLERMRQLMREESDKKTGGNRSSFSGDKSVYPYWQTPEKQTATIRFLPDKDDDNAWFWVEKQTIKLPFSGVVGGEFPSASPVLVTVPCLDMFAKNTCPIIAATRHLWNTDETLARKYWKKRSFIAQGFVVSSPFEESELPENPIRRFHIGPSLLEKLKAGLVDPEMESVPTDYMNGTDFKLRKSRKGEFNNYDTSEWSRRTRPLSESEQIAIEKHGLFNLRDFLGTPPDADGVAVLKAMVQASLRGDPFDVASFGAHYRAYGAGGSSPSVPEGVDDFSSTPVNTGASFARPIPRDLDEIDTGGDAGMQDILAKLKARTSASVRT